MPLVKAALAGQLIAVEIWKISTPTRWIGVTVIHGPQRRKPPEFSETLDLCLCTNMYLTFVVVSKMSVNYRCQWNAMQIMFITGWAFLTKRQHILKLKWLKRSTATVSQNNINEQCTNDWHLYACSIVCLVRFKERSYFGVQITTFSLKLRKWLNSRCLCTFTYLHNIDYEQITWNQVSIGHKVGFFAVLRYRQAGPTNLW